MQTPRQNNPKLPYLLIFSLVTPLCFATGCGDDNLGGAFRARDLDPDEAKYGPASPLQAGTEHNYAFTASYKRTAENDDSGLTQSEVQSAGRVCVKIDEVRDIHTEAYKDESETIVSGRVKITDMTGGPQMYVHDQDNTNATPEEVDAFLNNLWLRRLVGASANHGYETPKEVTFRTKVAPMPTNFNNGLSIVPFFEVRQLSTEPKWSGWTSIGGEFEGAQNLTNGLLRYFQDTPFSMDFMASPSNFKVKVTTPPDNCSEFADPTTCAMKDCTWASPVSSPLKTCMPLLRIGFSWRETLQTPAIQAGDVIHFIDFMYYNSGTLYKITEDIRPDTSPGENLSANVPTVTCNANCQSAELSFQGGFNDDPTYPAPCNF